MKRFMVPLALFLVIFNATVPDTVVGADSNSTIPEAKIRVETYPQWRSGNLALYIMDFPQEGVTYTQSSIRFRVAVWGATPENPIVILLNGEEAARIEGEGLFTYEWSLMGSHHLLIRCRNRIFNQAQFNIKAPPPPAAVILLEEFQSRLAAQRSTVMLAMLGATIAGIPTGIWVKRKTKIMSAWALMPLGVFPLIGIRYLPDLYMLIPYGLSASLVYCLARGYATEKAVTEFHDSGLLRINTYPFDDEGKGIITDVGPRHWRTGFIHVTPLTIEGKEGYLPLEVNGKSYPQIITRGNGMKETDSSILIKSEWSLAQAFAESKLIERLQRKVAEMELAEMLMNRALPVVITRMMQRFEDTLRENIINQDLDADSLHQQVKEATVELTDELQRTTPPSQGEEIIGEG
jgi:hypothetical protein